MKENLEKIKKYIKEHPWKFFFIILGTLYVAGLLSLGVKAIVEMPGIINKEIENPFTLNPLYVFKELFTTIKGYIITILLFLLELYVYRFVIKPRIKEERGKADERGFRVLTDEGKYGTAELITDPGELGDIVDVKPLKETTGVILGKPISADTSNISEDTDPKIKAEIPVISICSDSEYKVKSKDRKWKIDDVINNKLNNHISVFGASGTMKSRALARNLIMQDAIRGESIIITDPKGELYEDCAKMLENMGYDVKMFNLNEQKNSDSWNCLLELLDEDGHVDSFNAKILADTIVQNASSETDYWSDNARNILKAVCLYVAQNPDPSAPKNMGEVYDIISSRTTQEIDTLFRALPENNVARRSYNIFGVCTEQVKGQILNGLGIMLDVFQDDMIRNITTDNEINLSKPVTEKCAYFCITSDQHKVFDFLAVLFYAMLFIKLVRRVDGLRHSDTKTIPVNLILDEFPNIGQIPDFCKKISTVRSRQINITVIFQNIVQMQNRYPYGQWEEILGNCDTTIFLGCTDETTAKYISDKTGIATIEVETQNTKYERDVMIFNQNTSYNEVRSSGQRKVLNPDEVLRIKNTEELIFLRGQKPLKAKKFDYTLHPMSKNLVPQAIGDHVPQWLQRQIDEEKEREEIRKKREEELRKREEEELQRIKDEAEKRKNEQNASLASMFTSAAGKMNSNLTNNQTNDKLSNLFNPPIQKAD